MHRGDSVCLSDGDGLKHIDTLLKSKYTTKDMGTLGFDDSDVEKAFVVEPRVASWGLIRLDSIWTLDLT